MYPPARHQRQQFRHAYEMMLGMKAVPSKKQIRYQLMRDPESNEMFFGSDDSNFNSTWEVILGKTLKKDQGVDLTDEQIVANCLLNAILIGRHPKAFDADYRQIAG